ncbi:MAG: hypothetical protein GKR91_10110 [Pseudomonadales bacterium]|nr:hypothetical protein [Pseudomonadales bacterium]
MELIVFFLALIILGMVYYSFCCLLFFGFTSRPVLLAFSQSWKLSIASIIGVLFVGFGAIVLPTLYLNASLENLPGYKKGRDITVGVLISTACSVAMFFSSYGLAFSVFE